LRPCSLSIRKDVYDSQNITRYKSLTFCYGNKKEIDHYYEYTFNFFKPMVKRKNKYFAVTFMGRMTHDFLNIIYFVDQPIHDLLNKLFKQQLLNNTVVILFGYHGLRYGSYVWQTLIGQTEFGLPMKNIYLPPEYSNHNNLLNLKTNVHRLINAFDIHTTLLHIAKEKSPQNLI
jgi:membrane-anchored protein YejM (alkaline phosphatase superfamily)